MARDHARIRTSIWRDPDFRALSTGAQYVYFMLVSQPNLSYVGVIDWWPNRFAALSRGADESLIAGAVDELGETRFVVLDEQTSELLVRTYVRHDGVLARANMGKAMGRSLEKVVSLELREVILNELARLYREDANQAGWTGFGDLYEADFGEVVSRSVSSR